MKNQQNNGLREVRKKDVADSVKDVLNNNADPHQIAASLHKSFDLLEKNSFAEREAIKNILASNILLAKAVSQMSILLNTANSRIEALETQMQVK